MSLGEIMVLLIVGIVVVGPKNLPSMMRTAGQWVSKLRRMSTDLRSQSGIDDLIRHEGLEKEIAELRSLARMNVVDTLITPALGAVPAAGARDRSPYNHSGYIAPEITRPLEFHPSAPLREREYPVAGCDAHGALADDAGPYIAHEPEAVTTEAKAATFTDIYGHAIDAGGQVIDVAPTPDAASIAAAVPAAEAASTDAASSAVPPATPAQESATS